MKNLFQLLKNKYRSFLVRKRNENCQNGNHDWMKNPNWYQRDKHGNYIFEEKTEFVSYQNWFESVYYKKCLNCGLVHTTRSIMSDD